jgi:hypothetical protein
MNVWALATHVAIWILIAGSLAIFTWFLVEVMRLAQERLAREHRDPSDPEGGGTDEAPSDR